MKSIQKELDKTNKKLEILRSSPNNAKDRKLIERLIQTQKMLEKMVFELEDPICHLTIPE